MSPAPYSSLNLGLSTADSNQCVQHNRRVAAGFVGGTPEQMAIAGQVHGADVLWVDQAGLYPGFDGLVTDKPGIILSISAADCAAVLFADRESNVIGACHAGWRGHVGGVIDNTVAEMVRRGAHLQSMTAYVSPCISAKHFEVGEEVTAHFLPQFVKRRPEWPKPHIDLSASIEANLVRCGISQKKIERSLQCTYGEPDQFYSHRAQNGKTGRMMGMICIRPSEHRFFEQ